MWYFEECESFSANPTLKHCRKDYRRKMLLRLEEYKRLIEKTYVMKLGDV